MDNLRNLIDSMRKEKIRAKNKVRTSGLALCFNCLQVPHTDMIAITLTVMCNKRKKNALHPSYFAKIMRVIEQELNDISKNYDIKCDLCCRSLNMSINPIWYQYLDCHRLFFVPENILWVTLGRLFNQSNTEVIHESGIQEISVNVQTNNSDCIIKFF